MIRAKNCHSAGLMHLAPGEVGDVDEKNVAVAAFVKAGKLVPEAVLPASESAPSDDKKAKK